ncbi:hypothetical protein V8E51_017331 [Hyaloscypha variabilis]
MGDIYSCAERVIGWLGDSLSTAKALEILGELANEDGDEHYSGGLSGTFITSYSDRKWGAVVQLLRNEWFQRTWIIQEVVLARRLDLQHGNEALAWGDFISALNVLMTSGLSTHILLHLYRSTPFSAESAESAILSCIASIIGMDRIKGEHSLNPEGLPLSVVLRSSRGFGVTLPKDRVYGILGLTTLPAREGVPIDYSAQTTELELSLLTTKTVMISEPGLDYLDLAGIGHREISYTTRSGLPSWAPNWMSPVPEGSMGSSEYRCASYLAPTWEIAESDLLRINGILLDQVDCVSDILISNSKVDLKVDIPPDLEFTLEVVYYLEVGMGLAEKASKDTYPDGPERLLWRAVSSLGQGEDGNPRYTESFEQFSTKCRILRSAIIDACLLGKHTSSDLVWKSRVNLFNINERRLCLSSKGYFGVVPAFTEAKDVICVISGARLPYIIRPISGSTSTTEKRYQLIGACWIDGIMFGELAESQQVIQEIILE